MTACPCVVIYYGLDELISEYEKIPKKYRYKEWRRRHYRKSWGFGVNPKTGNTTYTLPPRHYHKNN